MKKRTLKVGVASLAVTAMLASTSVTDVFAAKSTNPYTEWNNKIVQRMVEQLNLIQQKHGVNQTEFVVSKDFKVVLNTALNIINKEIKPVVKPVITPEVKPEEKTEATPVVKPVVTPVVKPEVTPVVKPEVTPEVKPVVTPEVKPEVPVVTPEVKPEAKPVVTPEVKPEAKPVVTPEVKPEVTPVVTPEVKPEVTPVVTPEVTTEEKTEQVKDSTFTAVQQEVLSIVNKERAAVGLNPLVLDAAVSAVATEKARDMDNNNYFSHQSPTYGSPFDMLKQFGVSYSYAGENIATGQRNATEVMNDWMNSTGHRQNILSSSFTKIGVGYVNGKWVQMFIG